MCPNHSGDQSSSLTVQCPDESDTQAFARRLAPLLDQLSFVSLKGDLGAGKTTLVRALLGAMGYSGKVKSPTYALVEPYEIEGREVFHFDLYRLSDPEELDFFGLDDYFTTDSVCLVEWAEKGEGMLPPADLEIELEFEGQGRRMTLMPLNAKGLAVLEQLGSG